MTAQLAYLKELLPLLKANGVREFTGEGLIIKLDQSVETPTRSQEDIIKEGLSPDQQQGLTMTNDALMSADKILGWSGSPDSESLEIPLTDDKPLEG